MCFPCGPAFHFFGFRAVFQPCFIRGSRISCFATFSDECSIGGEGTTPSQRSAFPRQDLYFTYLHSLADEDYLGMGLGKELQPESDENPVIEFESGSQP